MFRIKNHIIVLSISIAIFLCTSLSLKSQEVPSVLNEGTLEEQYDYLQQRTLIYNNFRAIREDMFQKIKRNSMDSLNRAFAEIRNLNQEIAIHEEEKDSLRMVLDATIEEKNEAIEERDSLFLFGIPMSKTFYNVFLWTIIGILALLFLISGILYKRSNVIASQKTREMKELQNEYDEYRKSSRERFEKQSIDHFNELKRLKGI